MHVFLGASIVYVYVYVTVSIFKFIPRFIYNVSIGK